MKVKMLCSNIMNLPVDVGYPEKTSCLCLSPSLMEEVNLHPLQEVKITGLRTGKTIYTYVIPRTSTELNGIYSNFIHTESYINVEAYCYVDIEENDNYKPLLLDMRNN